MAELAGAHRIYHGRMVAHQSRELSGNNSPLRPYNPSGPGGPQIATRRLSPPSRQAQRQEHGASVRLHCQEAWLHRQGESACSLSAAMVANFLRPTIHFLYLDFVHNPRQRLKQWNTYGRGRERAHQARYPLQCPGKSHSVRPSSMIARLALINHFNSSGASLTL